MRPQDEAGSLMGEGGRRGPHSLPNVEDNAGLKDHVKVILGVN